jgi:ATP-dependent Clp protease ATP-binding subunit ClpX
MSWFSNKATPQPPAAQSPQWAPGTEPPPGQQLSCSFCGKSQAEVLQLIAGPSVYICDECVRLCTDIIAEQEAAKRPPLVPIEAAQLLSTFDEQVVGQRPAKRAMVAALRQQALRLSAAETTMTPLRLLLVGPTGSGKTTLGRAMCSISQVPSYHVDVSRLSESGYVGDDIENLLSGLLQAADELQDWAEQGLIFLDGLEKLRAEHPLNKARDISGDSVQRELIRLLDGLLARVPVNSHRRHPQATSLHFRTDRLLIAGAVRLDTDELPPGAMDREIRDALRAAGIRSELLSRFDRVIRLSRPEVEAMVAILEHPTGLIAEARRAVEALGGSLHYTPEALRRLARVAAGDTDGAWALRPPIQRHLEEIFSASSPAKSWQVDEPGMAALIAGAPDDASQRHPYR